MFTYKSIMITAQCGVCNNKLRGNYSAWVRKNIYIPGYLEMFLRK